MRSFKCSVRSVNGLKWNKTRNTFTGVSAYFTINIEMIFSLFYIQHRNDFQFDLIFGNYETHILRKPFPKVV